MHLLKQQFSPMLILLCAAVVLLPPLKNMFILTICVLANFRILRRKVGGALFVNCCHGEL